YLIAKAATLLTRLRLAHLTLSYNLLIKNRLGSWSSNCAANANKLYKTRGLLPNNNSNTLLQQPLSRCSNSCRANTNALRNCKNVTQWCGKVNSMQFQNGAAICFRHFSHHYCSWIRCGLL